MNYAVDVVCEHSDRPDLDAPPRVVCRPVWSPPWTDDDANEWPAAWTDPDGGTLQTYYGELRRLTEGLTGAERWATIDAHVAGRGRLLRDRRTGRQMHGDRWQFWCADCGATVPIQAAKLLPILDALRIHGVRRVALVHFRRLTLR